jgi:hypothetical protein
VTNPENVVGGEPPEVEIAVEPPPIPAVEAEVVQERENDEHAVVAWTKAIFGGIKDTARQVLDEGRRGAEEAYDEGWRRFDDKTRFRRNRP